MKKILVMPIKNEEWILEKTLRCASMWADDIIVADQNSTDKTLEICGQFKKVKVIKNEARFHSSNVRKLLLDAARQIEGQNVIFSFDADEIPTTHFLQPEFWQKIASLPQGSAIEMQWVNLWRSPTQYRDDSSVWSKSYKVFGFVDDRISDYDSLNVINDHTSRVPSAALQNIVRFDLPKVLHFQFVNWDRLLSKQAYYRVIEYVQKPQGFLTALKINKRYFPSKYEGGRKLKAAPADWILGYRQAGIDLENFPEETIYWFDFEVLKYLSKYGIDNFQYLDIWDINWEQKRQVAAHLGQLNSVTGKIVDPRNFVIKFYHRLQPLLEWVYSQIYLRFKQIL